MNNNELDNMKSEKKLSEYWFEEIEIAKKSSRFRYDSYNNAYKKDIFSMDIDSEVAAKIKILCKNNEFLIYTFLVAGLSIELYKYGLNKDITLGVLGHKINGQDEIIRNKALPLNVEVNNQYTCKEFMGLLRKKILKSYEMQDDLNIDYLINKNLCKDIMDIIPISIGLIDFNNENTINYVCNSSRNEIAFCFDLRKDDLFNISVVYNSNLYMRKTIELLVERYRKIINYISNNFEEKILTINMISDEEKNKILYRFNNTSMDYEKDKTIIEIFERQVDKAPNSVAVVFQDMKLTYKELNEKSNQLAETLRNSGVKPNSIVGIMLTKSQDMIIAIIAILKAGGGYLPIDHNYPENRIEYMLKDSNALLLLTNKSFDNKLSFNTKVLYIEDETLYSDRKDNLNIINDAESLAYVIYTSGSTGTPKGVLIKQRSIVNLSQWFGKTYSLNENINILQNTNLSFDVSVEEILVSLLNGAKIHMATEYDLIDKENFKNFINRNNINIVQVVPSTMQQLIIDNEKMDSIKVLICGGEALPTSMKSQVIKLGYNLYNCYGPTETSVDAITSKCVDNGPVIIGKPIANTRAYIINKDNQLLPPGAVGELCIAGDGLAISYLNRPDLTSAKFVDNPFEPNSRMYRTGDLARWLDDGNIEFIERMDNQIKIRGFRIELGEIENKLLQYEAIDEATVISRDNNLNEKYLCAYIISKEKIDNSKIRSYLKESLPEYMIPSYFVRLDKLPLTFNGKVDKAALPEPNVAELIVSQYEAPHNKIEKKLCEIWCSILGLDKIGINDNFFEIGGHSLKATVMIAKIHKELNREIPLKELFKAPTIKELGEFIQNTEENPYLKIEKAEVNRYYKTSSSQRRMYMIQQFDKNSIAYNMPMIFELGGEILKNKIEETFKKLVMRHESLRTSFETIDGDIVQKIDTSYEFELSQKKCNESIEIIIDNFIRPFQLEKSPLFRVELVENEGKNYLLIDMHHIISDGVSMSILINEFIVLYNGEELEPLKLQYKDFAAWQNKMLLSEEMKKQQEYWINRFNGEIPVLNLNYDYERPIIKSFEGASFGFYLDEETTKKLREIAKETGSTMNMILLSMFNILLSKYSGQDDIVVGIPIAGRPHVDLQNIIGMFVNTLAIRNNICGQMSYILFLKEVKENLIKAYENQIYQLDELIEKINIKRDPSRNPIFDVSFNMINIDYDTDLELDGLILKPYNKGNETSKFDLTLVALETDKNINLTFQYCSKLFSRKTIERFAEDFKVIIDITSKNVNINIDNINILTKDEQECILQEMDEISALKTIEFDF